MLYPPLPVEGLVTVGLNGALDGRAAKVLELPAGHEKDSLSNEATVQQALTWEACERGLVDPGHIHDHYAKLKPLASEAGLSWAHLDVYAVHGTSSKGVKSARAKAACREFFDCQESIFVSALQRLVPRVVLVEYKPASVVVERLLNLHREEKHGLFHVWRSKDSDRLIPVFLGSLARADTFTMATWPYRVRWAAQWAATQPRVQPPPAQMGGVVTDDR